MKVSIGIKVCNNGQNNRKGYGKFEKEYRRHGTTFEEGDTDEAIILMELGD